MAGRQSDSDLSLFTTQTDVACADDKVLADYIVDLSRDPDMARFDSTHVAMGLGGSTRINLRSIGRLLLARAIASGDVRGTVETFRSYVEENTASTVAVTAVSGLIIENEVRLGANIRLFPLRSLSPSIQRGVALGQADFFPSLPSSGKLCALVTTLEFKPVFFWPPKDVDAGKLERMQTRVKEALDDLNEARTLLTLLGIKCVPIMSWVQPKNPLMVAGLGTTYRVEGGSIFGPDYLVDPMATKELEERAARYFQIDPARRRTTLRIPLDRLDRSAREFDLVDKAIDLGIALEALLLHEPGFQGELTFRLSLRGVAWWEGREGTRRDEGYAGKCVQTPIQRCSHGKGQADRRERRDD
jgi:hypothetical protein